MQVVRVPTEGIDNDTVEFWANKERDRARITQMFKRKVCSLFCGWVVF